MTSAAPANQPRQGLAGVGGATRWACIAALGAVCLVSLAVASARAWGPVSDWAAMEVATQDVGTLRTPLVGSYSRFGWNHPGPLLSILYALPYRLSGANPNALLVGAVLLNTAAVAGVLSTCRRRGGTALLAIGSLGIAAVLLAVGIDHLVDPWNASAVFLPYVWFVFACWEITLGDRWAVVAAIVAGTIAAQGHLGYLPGVVALAAWCTLVRWRRARAARRPRGRQCRLDVGHGDLVRRVDPPPSDTDAPGGASQTPERRRWLAPLGATALLILLWVLPLSDAVGNGGGNLSAIAGGYLDDLRSFEVDTGAALGPDGAATEAGPGTTGDAVGLLARTYGTPSWLGLGEPIVYPGAVAPAPWPTLLLPLLALTILAVLTTRWRWRPGRAALGISGIGLLASALTLWAIRGPAFPWLVRPAWATALFLYVTTAWSVALLVRRRAPNPDAVAAALSVVAGTAVLALSIALLTTAGEAAYPRERDSATMAELRAQLEPWLVARGPQAYALHSDGTGLVPAYAGVAAIVGRTGSTPLLPGWYGRAYVPGHELDDPGPPVELVVAEGDAAVSEWEARPFATRVAASREMADSALSPAEQAVAVFAVPTGMVGRSSSGGGSIGVVGR